MEKLAILGGNPVRETYLSYGKQTIDEDDILAVTQVLKSDFLTCGPKVSEVEDALGQIGGANYATVVSNGTAALHCACLAAGIGPGDEVIVPPITFAASSNCVLYCGATPVFADIDPNTWEISPEQIKRKLTSKTKAVIAVDYTGQACDYSAILQICKEHGLLLIEDAAHSIGTRYFGKPVGSFADMTAFSFHPVKTVTAGEGGAVLTNSSDLHQKLQLISKHGITHNKNLYSKEKDSQWYYEQIGLGYNYRITDLQCALLLSQLKKLGRFAARRQAITQQYKDALSSLPELTLQQETPGSDTVRHLFVVRLNTQMLKTGRKEIFDALRAENIGVHVHYIPVYYFPYYRTLGYEPGLCPNAEALYQEILTLPLYYAMTDADVSDVVSALHKVIGFYRKD
jgi:UDP-4-amino-4,6-dideoxy-N-acetyl-beta-L-altrosamine transaminase